MDIKKIIEEAIPLDMSCQVKRSEQIRRRAKLKIDIEELMRERDRSEPYKPELEYKTK